MIDIKEYPFAIKHSGESGCGEDAFYLKTRLPNGVIVYAEQIQYPDGSRPADGEEAICGSCKAQININDLMAEDIYERKWQEINPPWIEFPDYAPGCVGFRMGGGEDYMDKWWVFWRGLPEDQKNEYRQTVPSGWEGYVV